MSTFDFTNIFDNFEDEEALDKIDTSSKKKWSA